MGDDHAPPPTRSKRRLRIGLSISLFFHVCLIALLLVYRPWQSRKPADGGGPDAGISSAARISSAANPSSEAPLGGDSRGRGRTAAEQVQTKLEDTIAHSELLTDEEKLGNLEENVAELERISSEQSIDQLTERLQKWLGTKKRADRPAGTPVAGEFDFNTAQILNVTRRRDAGGRWSYRCVLLDAEGRTMETELSAAEGERAYQTVQSLKAHPLAEKVYRQITLPLLDKILDDPARAANAVRPSRPDLPPVESPTGPD